MDGLLRAEEFDLVIPCNELTLLPLRQHRDHFQALTRLALPDDHSIEVLFDKHQTRELACSVGGRVAAGGLAAPGDKSADVFARLGTPVVVKPRRSYLANDLAIRGRVRVCRTPAMLEHLLPAIQPGEMLYEAFYPGRGAGLSVLASKGRILQAFEHHRVRETEAGSYYRVSAPVTPAFEACCAGMVAALNYTGIAMFEFRIGGTPDDWILLEVNARPWGSMPLPVSLGVDFPYRWYQLLVDGTETPPVSYPLGVYGRNLVPDLYSTASGLKAAPGGVFRTLAETAVELGRIVTGRERQDTLVGDDLKPGLRELREVGAKITGRLARAGGLARLPIRRRRARARAQALLRDAVRAHEDARSTEPLTVLFVCQGNICRSPLAERLMQQAVTADHGIRVGSAGMLPRPGRRTPAFGIEAAGAIGVNLDPHRSQHLSREDAQAATVILVFDEINRASVGQRYPDLATPVLKLGDFAPAESGIGDIADPIDRDLATYAATYDQIGRAVAGLTASLSALRASKP